MLRNWKFDMLNGKQYWLFASIVIFLCINFVSFGCQIDYIDLSTTPSYNAPTHGNQRIFLISFAHGEVHERNQNYLAFSALNKGIDTIISYRKRHIDEGWYKQNKAILDMPRGAGYWLWKPYFIFETLKIMSPNDILFYVDSGVYLKNSVEKIIKMLNNSDTEMVLFGNYHTNRHFSKRDAFDIMGVNYDHRNDLQLDASTLAIKKTPNSCDFIKKWLDYCCIERVLTDSASQAPEFEDFKDHRHDQAILTLLLNKYPDPCIKVLRWNDWKDLNIFAHHRRVQANLPITRSN